MKYLNRLVVFITFFIIVQCSSGFYKKERVYLSENLAIYIFNEKDYPDDKELQYFLKPSLKFPDSTIQDLKAIFSTLKVEKESIFSKDSYPLLYPLQIEQILDVLKDVVNNIPEGKRILVVHKFDPFRTVLSKEKRTTFLLWYDEDGYNLVMGEIHEDLLKDNFSTETDWLDIFPVSLKHGNPRQKIILSDFVSYKTIGDFTHYSWVIIHKDKIAKIQKMENTVIQRETDKNIESRLKKLKELFDNKLITKEEYESRKKEILKEL